MNNVHEKYAVGMRDWIHKYFLVIMSMNMFG